MSKAPASALFEVRHVQMARALFAALAAVMITFSPDHSAAVGLSVFSGFAIATAIVLFLSAWLVFSSGARWPALTLGILTALAGMAAGMPGMRSTTLFFVVVIAWALATGLIEFLAGFLARKAAQNSTDDTTVGAALGSTRSEARDALTIGVLTAVLGVSLLFVQPQYALEYTIVEAARDYTLTGITIAVGIFGAYAAIVAVYLAIAAFSPATRTAESAPLDSARTEGARTQDARTQGGRAQNDSPGGAA